MDDSSSQPSGCTAAKEPNATCCSAGLQQSEEHLSVLKSHIAFAHQCLSLLQNQLSHAADTLSILQDQVIKVQETMEQLAVPTQSPHAQECNVNMVSHFHRPQGSAASMVVSSVTGPAAVLVQNDKGQILGRGVGHAVTEGESMHAACRADYNEVRPGTQPVVVPCLCSVCIGTHTGATQTHHADAASHRKAHDNAAASSGCQDQLSTEVHMTSYPLPVSNASSETRPCGPTQVDQVLVKIEPHTSPVREHVVQGLCQGQPCSTSCATDNRQPPKVESSSPMAHQLLQVIDVLQGVDDEVKDNIKAGASLVPLSPHLAPQGFTPGISSFTDPMLMEPRMLHTVSPGPSPHSRQRSSPRRNRKQSLLLKHQASSVEPGLSLQLLYCEGNAVMTGMTDVVHSPDLMTVPRPVLACTLPPEFLVIPATNCDKDSPSSTPAPPTKQAMVSGSSTSDDGAVAITPFMTITTGITTVGLSSPDCDVGTSSAMAVDRNRGESVVTQSTGQVSADPLYSGHNLVPIDLCARDTSNVVLTRPSSVSGSSCAAMTRGGLLNTVPSSVNSQNGLQFVASSKGQSSSTEATTTTSRHIHAKSRQQPEAERAIDQQTALEVQALEFGGQFLPSLPMSSLGSSLKLTRSGNTGTKKPIILRRSSREQSLPEGVVVLVPTIADAKRLIASTGGTSGNTPVLIPQHMLNDIHPDVGRLQQGGSVASPTKRHFDSVSPLTANDSPAKRLAT